MSAASLGLSQDGHVSKASEALRRAGQSACPQLLAPAITAKPLFPSAVGILVVLKLRTQCGPSWGFTLITCYITVNITVRNPPGHAASGLEGHAPAKFGQPLAVFSQPLAVFSQPLAVFGHGDTLLWITYRPGGRPRLGRAEKKSCNPQRELTELLRLILCSGWYTSWPKMAWFLAKNGLNHMTEIGILYFTAYSTNTSNRQNRRCSCWLAVLPATDSAAGELPPLVCLCMLILFVRNPPGRAASGLEGHSPDIFGQPRPFWAIVISSRPGPVDNIAPPISELKFY